MPFETKTHSRSSESATCQNCHQNFVIEPKDFKFCEKIKVPVPTWCPECRMIRRLAWRNERSLYRRKCSLCNQDIISMHSGKPPLKAYCNNCWFSDKWDALAYGREYRWDISFFNQWAQLFFEFPELNLWRIRTNVDSEYINYAADNKRCYLSYSIVGCENVAYSYSIDKDTDCFDSVYLRNSELCYENIDGVNNHKSFFLIKSRDCIDSMFLFDCTNCQNCFMSSNLRNKKYVFNNVSYVKEEYFKKLSEIDLGNFTTLSKLKESFSDVVTTKSLHRFATIVKSMNATGDNILNSKDIKESFEVYGAENIGYGTRVLTGAKDSYDVYGLGGGAQLVYESIAPGFGSYLARFNFLIDASSEIFYSCLCLGSSSLFACIGLRNKSYCILNKQYTKEEYEKLVPRIIEHMNRMPYTDKKGRIYKYGEFFPPEFSPFSYNETIAQEYFPLTKEEALEKGYLWKDPEERNYEITLQAKDLPDHIKDVSDSILKEIIGCAHQKAPPAGGCNEQCTEAFRIIPQELQFLRKMNLPLPRLCPNCRHYQRIKARNPLKLWKRKCQCAGETSENKVYANTADHIHHKSTEHCPNEFETTYAPERPEIVYCEECYLREVV